MAASPRSPTPQTPTAKKASTPPKTVPDRDLRDAMNGLLNLAASLRRMERDATAYRIGRLEIPELHGRAWQAFNRDGVAGFLLMCPEGDMPAGSNVFLEILDRSARVQRGETGLMPLNWADVLIRVHRNVDAAQKRRNDGGRATAKGDDERHVTRLLRLYSDGASDERLRKAIAVLSSTGTVAEKLERLDSAMPIPATASGSQLGDAIGCSATAIKRTEWWKQNRAGKRVEQVAEREERHRNRARDCALDRRTLEDE